MNNPVQRFEAYLARQGLRLTGQGSHNFAVADHILAIYGTCAACRV